MLDVLQSRQPDNSKSDATIVAIALRRRCVANVRQLADEVGRSPAVVRDALEDRVKCGQVELLRPWRSVSSVDDDLDYYRWCQPTDRDHLFDQKNVLGCVCSRHGVWPPRCVRLTPCKCG